MNIPSGSQCHPNARPPSPSVFIPDDLILEEKEIICVGMCGLGSQIQLVGILLVVHIAFSPTGFPPFGSLVASRYISC
ncbi:hypothetical protein MtrunA17_Chr6g0478331 [Medicago truncatula]|uniref:Uncharacterized protein n=1 Tax=Medicago truncatula TaxID=3880 RepID=A0A396HI85_MEDTR|nr:hypothetical protein MtrunA17_Chr6g0478331 [Medicago truncatula]